MSWHTPTLSVQHSCSRAPLRDVAVGARPVAVGAGVGQAPTGQAPDTLSRRGSHRRLYWLLFSRKLIDGCDFRSAQFSCTYLARRSSLCALRSAPNNLLVAVLSRISLVRSKLALCVLRWSPYSCACKFALCRILSVSHSVMLVAPCA